MGVMGEYFTHVLPHILLHGGIVICYKYLLCETEKSIMFSRKADNLTEIIHGLKHEISLM